jgi:transcriptional regulator with XRE-family HTH domain
MPFNVPGISRIDGSSLAKFTSERASDSEITVAILVAELLDDITWLGAKKTQSISIFLTHAVDSLFDGNCAALALHLGLSKSQVHDWMQGENLPSLAAVVRMGYAFDCTLLDVITGNKAKLLLKQNCKLPRGLFQLSRNTGHKRPRSELLASLSIFMKRNPGGDAHHAACHLRVSPKFLRQTFPEQNAMLVRNGRSSRRRSAQETCDARDAAYEKSFLALAHQGTYPSRRKVARHLKQLGVCLPFADEKRAKRKAHAVHAIRKATRVT